MCLCWMPQAAIWRLAGNPAKRGSRVQDVNGVDGDALLSAIIAQARGWTRLGGV